MQVLDNEVASPNGRTGCSISAIRWCSSMPFAKVRDEGLRAQQGDLHQARSPCRTAPRRFLGISDPNRPKASRISWLRVVNDELKTRGVPGHSHRGSSMALKRRLEAMWNGRFPPQTIVQTCIVHLIRHSMDFASWKDPQELGAGMRTVYRAADAAVWPGRPRPAFAQGSWGAKYPAIAQSWRRNWGLVIPFFVSSARRAADLSTPRMLSRR